MNALTGQMFGVQDLRRTLFRCLTLMFALSVTASLGDREREQKLRAGVEMFRQAEATWDPVAFTNTASYFGSLASAHPDQGVLYYWRGAALFHALAVSLGNGSVADRLEDVKQQLKSAAVESIENALRLCPDDAESHALLSVLTGMRISARPISAIWRGRIAIRHRDKALQGDPANPRIYYLIGTSQYFAPQRLRSPDRGLAMLLKAAELFSVEKKASRDPLAPEWGHAHCLAFLGRLHEEMGDIETAVRYFRAVLELNPRHGMAREGLERCQKIRKQNQSL